MQLIRQDRRNQRENRGQIGKDGEAVEVAPELFASFYIAARSVKNSLASAKISAGISAFIFLGRRQLKLRRWVSRQQSLVNARVVIRRAEREPITDAKRSLANGHSKTEASPKIVRLQNSTVQIHTVRRVHAGRDDLDFQVAWNRRRYFQMQG